MCLQDWRLGRFIRSYGRTISFGSALPAVIPANPQRVAFYVTTTDPTTGASMDGTVSFGGVTVYQFGGFTASGVASLLTHGDIVTKRLDVTSLTAGPANISITEWTLPEEYLAAGMEEWKSQYSKLLR